MWPGSSRAAAGSIDLLGDVAEFAAQAIPGVDGAGVTLLRHIEGTPRIRSWAATAQFVDDIDKVQYDELHEGPCITCMQSRRVDRQRITRQRQPVAPFRWPGGADGVHSALSLPLLVGDQVIGTINSYAYGRDAFGEHAVTLGTQFAGPAAVSVYNAQLLAGAQERTSSCSGRWVAGR